VFAREVQRIDDLRVSEAELDYRMRLRQAFDDPNDGLSTKRGTQAIEALDGFRSRVQNEVTKVESRLTSETQRALFRRRAATLAQEADLRAGQYVRGETLRVQKETYEANTALDMEAIAETPENADALVRALDERTAIYADDIGMPPEAIALARAEARSKARLAQIQGLVSAERPDAGEVFGRVKGEMQAQDRARAEALVEQGDLIVQSQRRADDLFAAFGPNDERAALAEARTQFEGKLRDAVVQRLEQRYADERRLQAQSRDELMTDALGIIEGGGTLSAAQRAEIARTYPQGLRSLDARARQVANGTAVDTSWPEYERLQAVFETGDLSAIRDLNLSASRHLLSDTDYKAFIDRRSNILRGAADRANRAMTPLAIDRQILIDLQEGEVVGKNVRTMGDLNDYPASNRVFTQTRLAVLQAIEAKQAAKPDDPLTGPEMMQAIRSVTDDLVVQRKWGGGKVIFPRAVAPDGVTEAAPRRERPVVPTATRPDLATRNAQLRAAGLTANQRLAVLQSEGYTDEDVPQATRP